MKILITAGPTREYLDDVRYLSNASTGRMGLALACAAKAAGHNVVLIHGPIVHIPEEADKVVAVTSGREMFDAVAKEFSKCDVFISCAAVTDYRPKKRIKGKLKREEAAQLTVEVVQNPDIVREMAARRRPGQVVIGFALETANAEANARGNLARKGLDAIVLNPAAAIGAEQTEITVFLAGRAEAETVRGTKSQAARHIIALAERLAVERAAQARTRPARRPPGSRQNLKRKVR